MHRSRIRFPMRTARSFNKVSGIETPITTCAAVQNRGMAVEPRNMPFPTLQGTSAELEEYPVARVGGHHDVNTNIAGYLVEAAQGFSRWFITHIYKLEEPVVASTLSSLLLVK